MTNQITSENVTQGSPITKEQRITLMSPEQWEIFIEEWLETKQDKYFDIERLGGAGDKGRDVIAYIDDPQQNSDHYEWECYQCKRYNSPLAPNNVYKELGKIIYYSSIKDFPPPTQYYLVATCGLGTTLSGLLDNPTKLRIELKKNWSKYCKSHITKTKEISLTKKLSTYIDNFDFTIFKKLKIRTVIEEHKNHENHLATFGGILPDRKSIDIPNIEEDTDLRYVSQLIKAYDSEDIKKIDNLSELPNKYQRHFNDARKGFYKAEELRILTRDNLPDSVFEDLKENIYDGVINTAEDGFDNGFKKVKAVEDKAVNIKIESNPLKETCQTIDKKGLCHHLVNDEKIDWVDDE